MNTHLKSLLVALVACAMSAAGFAADASSLKPPPGAKVAIVAFEDLECPDCARAYPVLWEAAKAHKVPLVLHDFPLPRHPWSFDAAVFARFFDTKSQKLGDDFRGYIYQNQPNITADNLHQYVQKFADDNKVPLPFAIDPQGKLKDKVKADYALGQQIGLEHTPTIFVIGQGATSSPFVEVVDREKLSEIIEDMQKKAAASSPSPAKTSVRAHKKVR
ncbi:MAG TPA: thioredoxin domain-containing protein [Candidatus Angelobacter sp.]|nr:thioredoxin domain-containing protein [Candidatus Angelobacter sp.]